MNDQNCFKEAVCIDAMRVFDSCSSQDCLEDLAVEFCEEEQTIVSSAAAVKCRNVEVINTVFTIDPVPFNKGFFTVELTYTFKINMEAYSCIGAPPHFVTGLASFCKKVILYGSQGNTKRFSSADCDDNSQSMNNLPIATASVIEPIPLNCKLCNGCILVTIGVFSIVQLQRSVPVMIPIYDYCIPSKECSFSTDSPCEMFEKIDFPTGEFFPKGLDEKNVKLNSSPNLEAQSDE